MSPDPEFFLGDLFQRRAGVAFDVLVEDRRQLLHLKTLGIQFPDRIDVRDRVVKIQQIWVDDEVVFHHQRSQVLIFLRFALRALALAGRRPWLAFLSLCCGFAIDPSLDLGPFGRYR